MTRESPAMVPNQWLVDRAGGQERRNLWEAQDLYVEMSPFFQADRADRRAADVPRHGRPQRRHAPDPLGPEFHALEVLGKTAALYKYPYEDHGPATRETTMDLWARWVAWLDEHVKNAEVTTPNASANGSGR